MATVYQVKFIEGSNTDEIIPLINTTYLEILALDTGAILDTIYNLVVLKDKKYYSIMIRYSYNYVPPPPET